jgi:HSP20 family protein
MAINQRRYSAMALEVWHPRWGLRPWRPIRELEATDRFFEDLFGRSLLPAGWRRTPFTEKEWTPALEMFEKEDKFTVKAEMPGIREEDVEVAVSDNTLTIKGEKKADKEVKEDDYYFSETTYGSFFRSISLPSNVDATSIAATIDDGVLEIDVPKVAEVMPKKISVATKKKGIEGKKKQVTEKK